MPGTSSNCVGVRGRADAIAASVALSKIT